MGISKMRLYQGEACVARLSAIAELGLYFSYTKGNFDGVMLE